MNKCNYIADPGGKQGSQVFRLAAYLRNPAHSQRQLKIDERVVDFVYLRYEVGVS